MQTEIELQAQTDSNNQSGQININLDDNPNLKKQTIQNDGKTSKRQKLIIISFVVAMPTFCGILEFINVPYIESTVVDPIARDVKSCPNCNDKWKPPRSHHCSSCGTCQLEMDHHCPWIVNCVGYRNHQAFWLFTFYMMAGGVQYCWRSWNYFYYLYGQDTFFGHHNFLFYVFWGFTSTILFPTTILLIGLTFFHTGMVLTNSTTLDVMAGMKISCPCFPQRSDNRVINVYDRGVFANINNFFQGDIFTFWWPRENIGDSDGTQIPRSPYCNLKDIQDVLKSQSTEDRIIEDRIDVHQMTLDLDKKIEEEKHKYKDFNFQIQGKIFEYWKVYEQQMEQNQQQNEEKQQLQKLNENNIEEKKTDNAEYLLDEDDDQIESIEIQSKALKNKNTQIIKKKQQNSSGKEEDNEKEEQQT